LNTGYLFDLEVLSAEAKEKKDFDKDLQKCFDRKY